MSWQLWVAIGIVVAALLGYVATRLRHAQDVFDDITHLDRPAASPPADELADRRASRVPPEPGRHRRHG